VWKSGPPAQRKDTSLLLFVRAVDRETLEIEKLWIGFSADLNNRQMFRYFAVLSRIHWSGKRNLLTKIDAVGSDRQSRPALVVAPLA
jgi:hypothetical protein